MRGISRATFRAEEGRSFRSAYGNPFFVMAELWIAVFWRNFGPRARSKHPRKKGEKPRPTPAATIKLARLNEPRKPDLGNLAWNFRLGVPEATRMSRWFRK